MSDSWRDNAACLGKDTTYWFPESPTNGRCPSTRYAIQICRACPVRDQCLTTALLTPEPWGIWGGLTERQRAAQRPRRSQIHPHGTNAGYARHLAIGERACQPCRDGHAAYQAAKRRIRERALTRDDIKEIS